MRNVSVQSSHTVQCCCSSLMLFFRSFKVVRSERQVFARQNQVARGSGPQSGLFKIHVTPKVNLALTLRRKPKVVLQLQRPTSG